MKGKKRGRREGREEEEKEERKKRSCVAESQPNHFASERGKLAGREGRGGGGKEDRGRSVRTLPATLWTKPGVQQIQRANKWV